MPGTQSERFPKDRRAQAVARPETPQRPSVASLPCQALSPLAAELVPFRALRARRAAPPSLPVARTLAPRSACIAEGILPLRAARGPDRTGRHLLPSVALSPIAPSLNRQQPNSLKALGVRSSHRSDSNSQS